MTGKPPGRTIALAVVGGTALLVVTGFSSLWDSGPDDSRLFWIIWELIVGTGLAVSGSTVILVGSAQTRKAGWILLGGSWLLVAAPIASALGYETVGRTLWILALVAVIPAGLAQVARPREVPRPLWPADALLIVLGCVTAAAGARVFWLAALGATAAGMVIICIGWLLFESTSGDERRRVLWVILGVCTGAPASSIMLFVVHNVPLAANLIVAICSAVLALSLPLTAAIALIDPLVVDVRAVIRRVSVLVIMSSLTAAVYIGGQNAVLAYLGHSAVRPVELALVAVIAAGFYPTMRWVRDSVDELLFGGRPNPMVTLSRVGSHINAGSSPDQWLETLRDALDVPAVAIRREGRIVASAGSPHGATLTATTGLRAGGEHLGDLVVSVPPQQMRLPQATRALLELVAGPLAQALQASQLAEQLRTSRSQVVAALEEQRRRIRRDLHDGLGPTLTGIAYSSEAAANLVPADPQQAQNILRQLRSDTAEAIAEVRRIVYGLRPKALDELGLAHAITQRISNLHNADGQQLAIKISAPAELPELPAAVEVAAYRIAVEALTNVARHAGVQTAQLEIALAPGPTLRVRVRDNGRPTGTWKPGVGLQSMRERAEQIGGALTIHIGHGGAVVTAILPLDPDTPAAVG